MKRTLVALLVLGIAPLIATAQQATYSVAYETSYVGDAGVPLAAQKVTTIFPALSQAELTNMLFNSGLNPTAVDGVAFNPNWVHKMNVYVSVSGLAAGEDLHQIGFAVTPGAGLTLTTKYASPWRPVTATFTGTDPETGDPLTAPIFLENSDAGPSGTDLAGIVAKFGAPAAWNLQPGEAAPILVGSIYVKWNGTVLSTVGANGDPAAGTNWVKWTNNADGLATGADVRNGPVGAAVAGVSGTFGAGVPEPVTMALLAVGGIGMLLRRRS